jgi:hypothetical protein
VAFARTLIEQRLCDGLYQEGWCHPPAPYDLLELQRSHGNGIAPRGRGSAQLDMVQHGWPAILSG